MASVELQASGVATTGTPHSAPETVMTLISPITPQRGWDAFITIRTSVDHRYLVMSRLQLYFRCSHLALPPRYWIDTVHLEMSARLHLCRYEPA
jgi:hypothetical protein